ncbi:MAG: hypothetical protein H7X88_07010, partial [Gloeobacteraceae cyanobacterium ES-bin-316]|nr:hypothetical protein [Ferruginibacter sp.]
MTGYTKRFAAPLFFVLMFIFIAGGILENQLLQVITKPMLIPVLMFLLFVGTAACKGRTQVLIALFFSFAEDTILLFEFKNPALFIPGLVCFLITHILYIAYFLSLPPKRPSLLRTAPYLAVAVLAYGFLLLYILFPHLGGLKVPVVIYAV